MTPPETSAVAFTPAPTPTAATAARQPPAWADPLETAEQHAWRHQRRREIIRELLALPEEVQTVYVQRAAQSLKDAAILTPYLAGKIRQGAWKWGPLLSKVFEAYAQAVYGPSWHVKP